MGTDTVRSTMTWTNFNHTGRSTVQTIGERCARFVSFITLAVIMLIGSACRKRSLPQDFSGSISTNQPLLVLNGHTRSVNHVIFSPDGTRLSSAGGDGDATVKIWDSKTGELLRTLSGHDNGVYNVAFSPDGRMIASAGHDFTFMLWNTETGERIRTTKGADIHVWETAFSPDGERLAVADGLGVKVLNVTTSRDAVTLQDSQFTTTCVAFSPDGKYIAAGRHDWTAKVWEAASGRVVQTFRGHQREIWRLAFSPDSQRIATASHDHSVKLWDAMTGREVVTFTGHLANVSAVAFSPDGTPGTTSSIAWRVHAHCSLDVL